MIYFLKQGNKKSQDCCYLLIFNKLLIQCHGNLLIKLWIISTLAHPLKRWIKIFQNGAESCILQNGHMTEYFCLQRGCRLGDPISPYIFILCAEVLGHMRQDNSIRGITKNEKHFKLSQYADDTQVFLDGSEQSLKNTLEFFFFI